MDDWYNSIQNELRKKLNDPLFDQNKKTWAIDLNKYMKILYCLNIRRNHGSILHDDFIMALTTQSSLDYAELKKKLEKTLTNIFVAPLNVSVAEFKKMYDESSQIDINEMKKIYSNIDETKPLGNRLAYCIGKKFDKILEKALTDGVKRNNFIGILNTYKLTIAKILENLIMNAQSAQDFKQIIFRIFSNPHQFFFYKKSYYYVSKLPDLEVDENSILLKVKLNDRDICDINQYGIQSENSRQDCFVFIGNCQEADICLRNEKKPLLNILFFMNCEYYIINTSKKNHACFELKAGEFIEISKEENTFALKSSLKIDFTIEVKSEAKISLLVNGQIFQKLTFNPKPNRYFYPVDVNELLSTREIEINEKIVFGLGFGYGNNLPFIVCIQGSLFFKYNVCIKDSPYFSNRDDSDKRIELSPLFPKLKKLATIRDDYISNLEPVNSEEIQTMIGSSYLTFTKVNI